MPFPLLAASALSQSPTGDTVADIVLPAGIAAGHLLLAIVKNGNSRTVTWPGGWSELWDQVGGSAEGGLAGAYRFATGSETSPITVNLSGLTSSTHIALRITGMHASQAPEVGTPPAVVSATTTDPPSLTPSWGSGDTLWMAIGGHRDQLATVTFPTNYTDNQLSSIGSAGNVTRLDLATRNLSAASEDPGVFTYSTANFVQSQTLAVRGLPAGFPFGSNPMLPFLVR